jgi:hypothetical protein
MFIPAFDPLYLLFALPALLLGLFASIALQLITSKYQSELNRQGLSGLDIAERVAKENGFKFRINIINQLLGESYDPTSATLSLSTQTAHDKTITAAAITAHELGHVEQHHKSSMLFQFRTMIVPVVNIGTNIGYFLLIIGLILQFSELAWLGVILFALATFFAFITVPLELDASRRALNLLQRSQLIYPEETGGIKLVLGAAALTYVAALFQSLGQLLYFLLRVQGISRRSD